MASKNENRDLHTGKAPPPPKALPTQGVEHRQVKLAPAPKGGGVAISPRPR